MQISISAMAFSRLSCQITSSGNRQASRMSAAYTASSTHSVAASSRPSSKNAVNTTAKMKNRGMPLKYPPPRKKITLKPARKMPRMVT